MKKITLLLTTQGWVADFNDDPKINELFGCTLIPTSFTEFTPPDVVLNAVRSLNPDYQVSLEA